MTTNLLPMNKTAKQLINWYLKNKRDLPWRRTRDPFKIWLSEIILQQTRVDQGKAYYLKFVNRFKNVKELAEADENEVLKLWQGLGYYSRARNLHKAAKQIANDYGGRFPDNYKELLNLKGVGPYTAAAISSFAFGNNDIAVDGNVYRLMSRYLGISTPINTPRALKEFQTAGESLLGDNPAELFNQATMELGALICKPRDPNCGKCPLHNSCHAFGRGTISAFPVKKKPASVQKRYFYYLIIMPSNSEIVLQHRTDKGIWKHLYQFPLVETEKPLSGKALKKEAAKTAGLPADAPLPELIEIGGEKTHRLSHRLIKARFFEVKLKPGHPVPDKFKRARKAEIEDYPVPVLIENFLEEEKIKYR